MAMFSRKYFLETLIHQLLGVIKNVFETIIIEMKQLVYATFFLSESWQYFKYIY